MISFAISQIIISFARVHVDRRKSGLPQDITNGTWIKKSVNYLRRTCTGQTSNENGKRERKASGISIGLAQTTSIETQIITQHSCPSVLHFAIFRSLSVQIKSSW